MKKILIYVFALLCLDRFFSYFLSALSQVKAYRFYRKTGVVLNFIPQGGYDFEIMGDFSKFKIDHTSHIKSGSYLEVSGGLDIGRYFHCGRGLTVFTSTHRWKLAKKIPYEDKSEFKKVSIGDFVWCGCNVTILAGTSVGKGCVIGAGSVLKGDYPDGAIIVGNPAKVVSMRDMDHFNEKEMNGDFF